MREKQELRALFADAYGRGRWLEQLHAIFAAGMEEFSVPQAFEADRHSSSNHLGNLTTGNDKQLGIFEIRVAADIRLARNRVQLRNLVVRQVRDNALDGALAVYYDDQTNRWRFSYITVIPKLDEQGQIIKEQTAHKRYTYLLGEGAQIRTAVERFADLPTNPALHQLDQAFAVETLNKEFYQELYQWYRRAERRVCFPNDEGVDKDTHIASSLIRLLTRLLFVWFIKEKGLINPDLFDLDKVKQLIDWEKPSSYYKAILQNLFFATLNREIADRQFRTTTNGKANSNNYAVTNLYRYQSYFQGGDKDDIIALFTQTPFLNGGLFECLDREANEKEIAAYERDKAIRNERKIIRMDGFSDRDDDKLHVPNGLFLNEDEGQPGLINLLSQYQFTIEESAPLDIEVALDPELLGLVFENLLAAYNPETRDTARKQTGSYYTPREIVAYMVDESLKAYLAQAVPPEDGDTDFYRERLDDLFAEASKTGELSELKKADGTACIYEKEIPRLIEAISQINILDPAVGSGAFPMGVLQRMVSLLAILDPRNKQWKAQQLAQLPSLQSIEKDLKTAGAISDDQARNKAEAELRKREQEIEDLFDKQDHNYLRKLYLIENCLFGVDIQPIAIQIAKLRFFISLVIEQNPDRRQSNYGILALPNLETKFIAANSLIGLSKPKQGNLRDDRIEEKEKKLQEARHKHFTAKTLATKRKHRDQDEKLRTEIAELLQQDGWQDVVATKIAHWNPYNQNASADWFEPEWMFGVRKGFDVVIGNPPYIQLQKDSGKLGKLYQDAGFDTFARTGDIYQLFYEKGCQLLKNSLSEFPPDKGGLRGVITTPDKGDRHSPSPFTGEGRGEGRKAPGLLAYITSNSWLKAEYGKKTRRWFAEQHTPLQLLEIGKDVFENAIVDTNILIARSGKSNEVGKAVDIDHLSDKTFPPAKQHWGQLRAQDEKPWLALSAIEQSVMDKMEAVGTPLKEWDVSIYRGVTTGLNDAFVIDNKTKEALVAEDPKSAEIIKPVLRGRDIQRWRAQWAGLWLVDTHNGYGDVPAINTDIYSAIQNYLHSFYPQLSKRQDKGKTPYNLRHCTYHQDFEKEKLVWMDLTEQGRFAYDAGKMFCVNTAFMMSGQAIKYLCAVLNARLTTWFMGNTALNSGMGVTRWIRSSVETIPIPKIPAAAQRPFIRLVDDILQAKASNPSVDTTKPETQIDQLIYQLYNLTSKEIAAVEGKR